MEVSFEGGTGLVIGAEGEGISRLTGTKCDMKIALPMKGHVESLNASVAASIIMYRVMNCRNHK
jgi:23S rRNA (guanosine2251-2'-O)-methyltransferase